MRKWFDFSKKEIVRLFIIKINGVISIQTLNEYLKSDQ